MRILKAISALLDYPTADLQVALPEIRAMIAADLKPSRKTASALDRLAIELGNSDLIELQERYTSLFDRGRSVALHHYEHVHGDSRDRGSAMVAQMVFDAMAANQFYVFSHPKALGNVQTRLEDVMQLRNPTDPFALKPEIGEGLRKALRETD